MLIELRVENYAVIDHAVASFGPGLNLLSGETGAGKSILVDALALLLGGKASSGIVRQGAERAVVGCVFDSTAAAEQTLETNGIDREGDQIILRREVHPAGKSRIFVNNQPATAAVLRDLAPDLALVHSQGETLGSFDRAQQLSLLDRFASLDSGDAASAAAQAYDEWRAASTQLEELRNEERDQNRQAEFWKFAVDEIDKARIVPAENGKAEDEVLDLDRRRLANAEKLYAAAMSAHELLYESAHSAEAALGAAQRHLEELAHFDESLCGPMEQLSSARAIVEDVGATMRDYASGIHASPERLAEIEDRLVLLDRLKRKYGTTLADVAAYREEAGRKLERLENREQRISDLLAEIKRAAERYRAAAERLTVQRRAAGEKLCQLVTTHIADLALNAEFAISVTGREEEEFWSPRGWDLVDYRISTNPGEPLKPLTEIASGGEMSRVMLALKVSVEEGAKPGKTSARKKLPVPRTLVFDEIDIGIGGRAAEAVGKKLHTLARSQQVLCVTHLPQIAAFADHHLLVEKNEDHGRTKTSVHVLTDRGRKEEIARMISGARVTETSLRHAEQMIKSSRPGK